MTAATETTGVPRTGGLWITRPFRWIGRVIAYLFVWPVGKIFRRKSGGAVPTVAGQIRNPDAADAQERAAPKTLHEAWDETRVEVAERLWGEGSLGPCNGDYLASLAHLTGLDETRSLLHVGAGLGGASRAVSETTGVWVSAFEQDAEMAEAGALRSKMAGMTKKAAVKRYDPAAPKFKENSFNAAISADGLLYVEDKQSVVEAMGAALRTDGHLMLTECVLANADPPGDPLRNWMAREPVPPKLCTARAVYDLFEPLEDIELRVSEDVTDKYRSMVLAGWLRLLSGLTKAELTPIAAPVLMECEYWLRRVAAMDSGQLRAYRYHAIKLPPKRV